jgi:hypothetical protein
MLTSTDYGQQTTPPSSSSHHRAGGTSYIRSTYGGDSTSNATTPNTTRPDHDDDNDENSPNRQWQHLYVLPVLLLEFLAIALTRAVLPTMLLQKYGSRVYIVLGCADCVRGLLAFLACPVFGKLSDLYGRRICLLMTVSSTFKMLGRTLRVRA